MIIPVLLVQVHNLLSEIPKIEKLRKSIFFPSQDVVCTSKLIRHTSPLLLMDILFIICWGGGGYFDDFANVKKKNCRFLYG